jgi:hypothetical protein
VTRDSPVTPHPTTPAVNVPGCPEALERCQIRRSHDGPLSWFLAAAASADGRDGRDAAVLRVNAGGCRVRSGQRRGWRRPARGCSRYHATCVMAVHADRREAHGQKAARPMAHGYHDQPAGGRGAGRVPRVTSRRRRP